MNLLKRMNKDIWGAAIWVASLLLYGVAAAPSIVTFFDDSLEFQFVGSTFGIAHPTGYPLYIMLGGLWSRIIFPIGHWAWRMNIFSALAASLTIFILYLLTVQIGKHSDAQDCSLPIKIAGISAATVFAIGPIWWSQATIAEVYSLHGFFVAAILLAAIRIPHAAEKNYEQKRNRSILLLCLLLGLALTHHRTTILLIPGLFLYILLSASFALRPQRIWLSWLTAFGGPLLLYLYLPIQATRGIRDLRGDYIHSTSGFFNHVLGVGYLSFLQDNVLSMPKRSPDWVQLFLEQVGWPGFALACVGFAAAFWRWKPNCWLLILSTLTLNLLFAVNYRVHDAEVFLLPAILCSTLYIGTGITALAIAGAQILFKIFGSKQTINNDLLRNRMIAMIQFLLCAIVIGGILIPGNLINRATTWEAHDQAIRMAKVDFPTNSHVLGLEGQITALRYMQQAEGLGKNAVGIVADFPDARLAAVEQLMEQNVPLYLTQEITGIESTYSFSGEGPLVRVWPRGQVPRIEPRRPLNNLFASDTLLLEGADIDILAEAAGPTLRVVLYWRPTSQLTQQLKISLRILDAAGNDLQWSDGSLVRADRFPLRQVAMTSDWLPNEQIRDVHYLSLPPAQQHLDSPQTYRLLMIVYDALSVEEQGRWQTDLSW